MISDLMTKLENERGLDPKITILTHRDADGKIVARVYHRNPDLMVIGSVMDTEVKWGCDPTKVTARYFLDEAAAARFMTALCMEYLGREDIDFHVQEASPMVKPAHMTPRMKM